MGGMITQVVGLNHRDRVLTLTPIMSTPDPGAVLDAIEGRPTKYKLSPPSPEVIENAMAMNGLDWDDLDAVLENRVLMFKSLAGTAYSYDEEQRRTLFKAEIDRAINFPSTANHGPAIENSNRWHDRLGSIDVPTLVIHGTADSILPFDHGEALVDAIPGATMLVMEGVGHELPEGAYDAVIPAPTRPHKLNPLLPRSSCPSFRVASQRERISPRAANLKSFAPFSARFLTASMILRLWPSSEGINLRNARRPLVLSMSSIGRASSIGAIPKILKCTREDHLAM